MKCFNCGFRLLNFYYFIGHQKLCCKCSLELIQDVRPFKVSIKPINEMKGGQTK